MSAKLLRMNSAPLRSAQFRVIRANSLSMSSPTCGEFANCPKRVVEAIFLVCPAAVQHAWHAPSACPSRWRTRSATRPATLDPATDGRWPFDGLGGLQAVPGRARCPRRRCLSGSRPMEDLLGQNHRQRAGWAAVDAQAAADAEVLVEEQHRLLFGADADVVGARDRDAVGGHTSTQRPQRMQSSGESMTLSKQRRQRSPRDAPAARRSRSRPRRTRSVGRSVWPGSR